MQVVSLYILVTHEGMFRISENMCRRSDDVSIYGKLNSVNMSSSAIQIAVATLIAITVIAMLLHVMEGQPAIRPRQGAIRDQT